jgi:hypothetical protein
LRRPKHSIIEVVEPEEEGTGSFINTIALPLVLTVYINALLQI